MSRSSIRTAATSLPTPAATMAAIMAAPTMAVATHTTRAGGSSMAARSSRVKASFTASHGAVDEGCNLAGSTHWVDLLVGV